MVQAIATALTVLAGTHWGLGSESTVRFHATRVDGDVGCNTYGGLYRTASGGRLRFRDISVTAVGCVVPGPDLLGALTRTRAYRRGHGRLVLLDRHGRVLVGLRRMP